MSETMIRAVMLVVSTMIATVQGSDLRAAVKVIVDNGPHAGTFAISSEGPCKIVSSRQPKAHNEFQGFFGAPGDRQHDPKSLNVFTINIPDADVHGANGQFFLSIIFGETSRDNEYSIELRPGNTVKGTGTVTLTSHGQDAIVIFNAKTANGIAFHGTLECTRVVRY